MSSEKFKDIHKKILEFRNESLHGRYEKALSMIPAINNSMSDFQIGLTPARQKLLEELTTLFLQQVRAVQNLHERYFKQVVQPAKIDSNPAETAKMAVSNESKISEREIGKWGNKMSKSSVFLQPQTIKQSAVLHMKPIIEQSDAGTMQILQDRIVLPLTMPRFYRRIEDKTVLLEGDKQQTMQIIEDIASRSSSTIRNITDFVKAGTELQRVINSLNVNNVIGVIEDIDEVDQDLQEQLLSAMDRFRQMKEVRSILILTCCNRLRVSPLLSIDLQCRIGMPKRSRTKSLNDD